MDFSDEDLPLDKGVVEVQFFLSLAYLAIGQLLSSPTSLRIPL
jgi:hypothetical protein